VKLIQNVGHVLCQTFNWDIFGWFVEINNPVPANQVRFQQFRVTERFCVEGSNKRSDRWALK